MFDIVVWGHSLLFTDVSISVGGLFIQVYLWMRFWLMDCIIGWRPFFRFEVDYVVRIYCFKEFFNILYAVEFSSTMSEIFAVIQNVFHCV